MAKDPLATLQKLRRLEAQAERRALAERLTTEAAAQQAVAAAERAVKKGNGKAPGEAPLVLGLAQHKAGNKPAAVKAFKSVKGDPGLERVAKLWALRAQ